MSIKELESKIKRPRTINLEEVMDIKPRKFDIKKATKLAKEVEVAFMAEKRERRERRVAYLCSGRS